MLKPVLRIWKHDLRETVGLFVCFKSYFPIGPEDVDGLYDALVDSLNQLLYRLVDRLAVRVREWFMIGR